MGLQLKGTWPDRICASWRWAVLCSESCSNIFSKSAYCRQQPLSVKWSRWCQSLQFKKAKLLYSLRLSAFETMQRWLLAFWLWISRYTRVKVCLLRAVTLHTCGFGLRNISRWYKLRVAPRKLFWNYWSCTMFGFTWSTIALLCF